MLNVVAGLVGLIDQLAVIVIVYLLLAPSRGRSVAVLFASIAAFFGYALVVAGFALAGIPWQIANIVIVAALGALVSSRRVRLRIRRRTDAGFRWLVAALPSAAIIGALAAVQVLAVVITPELSIDGQLYHGPILAQLIQTGTLWGWQAPNQYMFYTDLTMLGGVNLATFTGTTVFDNGIQLPFLVVLVLALNVLLARRFDRAWVRVAFAALIVSSPVIWLQPRILYVDVAYGAAVASLMILILIARRVQWAEMLIAGICAAAILATKPAGILTSALLLTVWIGVAVWRRRASGWWRALWPAVLAATLPMVFGLAFYLRNLVSFGNPVYPVMASFGPIRFNGVVDFSIFVTGDRGSGLVDPGRLLTYLASIGAGMLDGVTKPDYDPRAGGFGHIPLAVLAITAAVLLAQLVFMLLRRRREDRIAWPWRLQLGALALVVATLMIQPSAYDTRYVIGPTAVLLGAVLLSSLVTVRLVDVVAASCALLVAFLQVVWTESNAYPGLHIAKELRTLGESSQPSTPGNPWGRGDGSSWLPQGRCTTIALQTLGGVREWGNAEQTMLSAMPYSLYGDRLCNTVVPMELDALESGRAPVDPVSAADYLVLYQGQEDLWRARYPDLAGCWTEVNTVPSSGMFPAGSTILVNECG